MKKIVLIISFFASIIGLAQDGSLDTSFNVQGSISSDVTMKLQSDGKIVLVERFYNDGDFVEASKISRLNSDGSVDMSFASGIGINLIGEVSAVTIQSNGKILIGGNFRLNLEDSRQSLVRLSTNGSYETGFGTLGIYHVETIAVQPDDKILVGGWEEPGIVRILPTGAIDLSFNSPFDYPFVYAMGVSNIVIKPDNKILGVGYVPTPSQGSYRSVFVLNSNGQLDTNFQEPSNINFESGIWYRPKFVALEKNGNILIGWTFTVFSNTGDIIGYDFVRLNPNGNVITVFHSTSIFDPPDTCNSFPLPSALQEDGKIIMAGLPCSDYYGYDFRGIARLNVDGSVDQTFNPGTGANSYVSNVVVQPDGKIIISGYFTEYNGVPVNRIIRLNSTRLSSSEFNNTAMSIYPNPVTDNLHIQFLDNLNGTDISELEIYDITMKKIDFNMPNKDMIDVSSLSSGVYLLKVKTDNSFFTSKFIKR